MDKYQKIRPLGKGSFGSAILVKRKSDNEYLVIKEVNLSKMSAKEREEARNECRVLQQLSHPNIVRYVEHYESKGVLYIIMEYADGGDLHHKIKAAPGRMSEEKVLHYFAQMSLAVEYLHSRHILHRDIKSMNVFLMKNGTVKLGDFGISTVLRNTLGMAKTVCGTPYYFSPELCKNKPYNNKSDVWAMGVLLFEMITGRHPFDGNSMNQLMQNIVKAPFPAIPTSFSRGIRQVLDACLQKEPLRRPTIRQVLALPLVRTALERLETDLMLATQCKIRLQDIIDFPVKDAEKPKDPVHSKRNDSPSAASQTPPPQVLTPPPRAVTPRAKSPQIDFERIDAFIQQLNRPINDRAKDALHEYMKKKHEEMVERKRKEAELKKAQELRNDELRRIMEEHQRHILEQAKARQLRQDQELKAGRDGNDADPRSIDAKRPAAIFPPTPGRSPTPRRKNVRHILAANSPRNARHVASPPPVMPQQHGNAGKLNAERAQHWAERQQERRKSEQQQRRQRRLEEDKKAVQELDFHGAVGNRVLDPQLQAWVQRKSEAMELRSDVPRSASKSPGRVEGRSIAPQAPSASIFRDEVPAGVEARRAHQMLLGQAEEIPEVPQLHRGSSFQPHTPQPSLKSGGAEYRKAAVQLDASAFADSPSKLQMPTKLDEIPSHYDDPEKKTCNSDDNLRTEPIEDDVVPVAAYNEMLQHLHAVLDSRKNPHSAAATRHTVAIADAKTPEKLDGSLCSSNGGEVQGVVETEEFLHSKDDDDDDIEEEFFEDEEAITPIVRHRKHCDVSPEAVEPLEEDEALSFSLLHLCGCDFTGVRPTNPRTGSPLFPSSSSAMSGEFQLRTLLERRLGSPFFSEAMLHISNLNESDITEGAEIERLKRSISRGLYRVKKVTPTQGEVDETLNLCCQLYFFQQSVGSH